VVDPFEERSFRGELVLSGSLLSWVFSLSLEKHLEDLRLRLEWPFLLGQLLEARSLPSTISAGEV
jgi:hypothetical protein